MGRWIERLIRAQDGWARPFGDFNHRWLTALFAVLGPTRDWLSGTWLGHPLHAAITDVPVGGLLVSVALDVAGLPAAADVALALTVLVMLAAALSGAADYATTDGTARVRATVHATLMVATLAILVVSLAIRATSPADRTVPIALSVIGFVFIAAGAFVGGDVVYLYGNMVSRHATRGAGTKWVRLELGEVRDLGELPEGRPVKAKAGINDLVLVRDGPVVHALHAVCAHAGGPLAQGTVVDGCLQCPWHGARYRLSDGHRVRGPSLYDQPAFEIRTADDGGCELRRASS